MYEIVTQFPAKPPKHNKAKQDYENDERYVRRYFGKAAHLFTVDIARRLAPHLPLAFHVLCFQQWSFNVIYSDKKSVEERRKAIQTVTLQEWDEDDDQMRFLFHATPTETEFEAHMYVSTHGLLVIGSGADPVYLFFK